MGLNGIHAIFQIAGVGIIAAVLTTLFKHYGREEFAQLATLTGFIVILIMVVSYLDDLFTKIRSVFLIQ
jgi:stage III sporulation protein AC